MRKMVSKKQSNTDQDQETQILLAELQVAWPSLNRDEIVTLALRALHTLSGEADSETNAPTFTEADLEAEVWKPMSSYSGCEVSNLGRVRGGVYNPSKIRKISRQTGGYGVVVLMVGGRPEQVQVSRIVATEFIRPPQDGEVLNHKNGNKLDNRANNLEWLSQKENIQHSNKSGLRRRESQGMKRITNAERDQISRFYGAVSKRVLAAIYGIKSSEVLSIVTKQ